MLDLTSGKGHHLKSRKKTKMENIDSLNCIIIIADFPNIYRTGNQTPKETMIQSGYSKLFSSVTIEAIADYLIQKPELIEDWINYSEDIRHSPAWGFGQEENDSYTVAYWRDGKLIEKHSFNDKFVACAKMIKMTFEEIKNNRS
jgi:hypothetical protein